MTISALISIGLLLTILVIAGTALARLSRPKTPTDSNEQLSDSNTSDAQNDIQSHHAPADLHSNAAASTDPLDEQLIDKVNAVLPQTQCAQCGYPGCRPYAQAIIEDHELINRCPPGGERTITELSQLLGTPIIPLDLACGEEKPVEIAVIDEDVCIGCTLCILACPVDAIVGAGKLMHTVIAEQCTGCELCIPPCPVDCIDMVIPITTTRNWQWPLPT